MCGEGARAPLPRPGSLRPRDGGTPHTLGVGGGEGGGRYRRGGRGGGAANPIEPSGGRVDLPPPSPQLTLSTHTSDQHSHGYRRANHRPVGLPQPTRGPLARSHEDPSQPLQHGHLSHHKPSLRPRWAPPGPTPREPWAVIFLPAIKRTSHGGSSAHFFVRLPPLALQRTTHSLWATWPQHMGTRPHCIPKQDALHRVWTRRIREREMSSETIPSSPEHSSPSTRTTR